MIAIVGQSVVDHVRRPGEAAIERLGGSPVFAAAALAHVGREAVILTRGGTPALRAPLHAFGFEVVVGPSTRSFISELEIFGDGERHHEIGSFGDPFTVADVTGWMAPALARSRAVVVGAQWRGDFPGETLRALAADGRTVFLDGQGPTRPERLGVVRPEGPLDPAWVTGVTVLKCSEEEADALLGTPCVETAAATGCAIVIVTRGHVGATVFADGRVTAVGVEPVLGLADTVGAGDTFLSLLAVAMLDGAGTIDAVARACAGTAEQLRRRLEPRP
jgi:fructokinase